ncbi:MAG TPA: NADH-ubiquinone oxidoreductase-F iron-sulfur binding region domain-containing protein [Candidatus Moranbacteria bacterium]|nr:NADH-ubiquinone oxidoreductase-F iron-sulfur binding region domain-containing protein [Candidatus Moranbacteria bacterium]
MNIKDNLKIITEHWGKINPLKIRDYIDVGGYEAIRKFIEKMKPEEAIEEIKKSGLVGRGGAGFSTGEKWEAVKKNKGEKYFICNLDESEPGTYKDRAIVDNNPHLLLEGIIISALAIDAKKAYIYINGRYIKQREILEKAVLEAASNKFIGKGIINSHYDLEIEIFSGAGAYICGEETALINSIEGKRGEPKFRPPYPTETGLWGKPTLVNNAETVSNIPWIIINGGKKYSEIGSAVSPGTKLYVLGGAVRNSGVFEGPTGMTIGAVIDKLGGGLKKGKELWFSQIGGSSGRLVLENELDNSLTFNKKSEIPLGSGAVFVFDKHSDIYDFLLSIAGFFRRESCGKCVPCREGTFRLYEITERMKDGEISERDKEAIKDILWTLNNTTFCPFGKFAAVAFLDAVEKLKILDL